MSTNSILDDCGNRPPLALIAGPTASGKSDCAVALARELARHGREAVVVNADSSQVYADLSVLSARPTTDEMGGIEHRLYGTWDGAMACSAADWAAAARAEITSVHASGRIPILVGGTGLYVRTLLDGIAPVPAIAPHVREAVRAMPVAAAHAALVSEDPERAARLAPTDATRIARALEVVRSTGKSLTHWQARVEGGISDSVTLFPVVLLPERTMLYQRCDLRFERMMARGALDEVRTLLDRNLDPALPVMRAIGVPELAQHCSGLVSIDEAAAAAAQATRRYAKRQFTWLRHQPPSEWPKLEYENFQPLDIGVTLCHAMGLT